MDWSKLNPFKAKNSVVILDDYESTTPNPVVTQAWDGEKTPGELGSIIDTMPDHLKIRLRAYDMNLKTDLIKVMTGKFFKWVIGNGLKLQAEPNKTVLELSGIKEDLPLFQKNVEALFNLYVNSKYSDYHKKDWLHKKANEAFQTAFLGGDCLCVIRIDKFGPNIQVIDGDKISNPVDYLPLEDEKIKIVKGIELGPKGEHVAFHVQKKDGKHERVEAVNKNGQLVAWMMYGDKHRINHERGISKIAAILEKVTQLDSFITSTVIKAKNTADVVYAFEHGINSTGENPLATSNLSSRKVPKNDDGETIFEKAGKTANMLRQAVSGQVVNLPTDAKISSISNPSQTEFNEFFRAIFVVLCASIDIPEEVALQKYEQSYSSSRAAINGWEHILDIYRKEYVVKKFYEPFYRVWLDFQIYSGKIKSNGFLKAKKEGDFMAMEAFYNVRFTGKKMPHIDPAKEAKAIRTLLGTDNDGVPLISLEQATEMANGGDWIENYNKFKEENKDLIVKQDDTNENDGKQSNVDQLPKS